MKKSCGTFSIFYKLGFFSAHTISFVILMFFWLVFCDLCAIHVLP